MENRELTYGEQAVGLTFNPSKNIDVQEIKEKCAGLIDLLYQIGLHTSSALQAEEVGDAINCIKTAQMWAVKAVTRKL